MRALFAATGGAIMLVGVAMPTMPVSWPLAIGAALATMGVAPLARRWVEGRSGIEGMVGAALHPNRQADRDARIIATANRAQVRL